MRTRTAARAACSIVALMIAAGCGSDAESGGQTTEAASENSADTAQTVNSAASGNSAGSGPFAAAAGIAPADGAEITAADDVHEMLTALGFPSDWFVPEGLPATDVVGVFVRQSSGDDSTVYTYGFAFRQPAGVVDELAKDWYAQYASALGIGEAQIIGNKSRGDIVGRHYSGGLADEPAGALDITIVGADGGPDPVVVEAELEIVGDGPNTTLKLSPDLLEQLPDLAGCTPFVVSAELALYASPNNLVDEPGYRTIFDGTCPATATFDAAVAWAEGRDGLITQGEDRIEVTDTTAANGTLVHVGASASGSIRIDTEQLLDGA